jgi:transposase
LRPQLRLLRNQRFGATSEKISLNKLPSFNAELSLSQEEKTCLYCNGLLTGIGADSTKQIEHIPASIKAKDYVVFKYACKHCEGTVKRASLPNQLIHKRFATTSLIAYLKVSKYRAVG